MIKNESWIKMRKGLKTIFQNGVEDLLLRTIVLVQGVVEMRFYDTKAPLSL